MIVQRFVSWCDSACSRQRAEGVASLAEAFAKGTVPADEQDATLAALTLALDDPSPKVRLALAASLAASPLAPRHIMLALGEDIDDIGCLVVGLSEVLTNADLVDLFASGSPERQVAISERFTVSMGLAAAIAEVGALEACIALLRNDGATIAGISLRRIVERHGEDAALRGSMLDRDDLPADVRQTLILLVGRALEGSGLLRHSFSETRARRLTFDACERATAILAQTIDADDIPALVEHLRLSGQLSTAFLIRIVCSGNIDLFSAALVALSGLSERRVRAVLVDGREAAFFALARLCCLPPAAAPLLRAAVQAWKQAIAGRHDVNLAEIASQVMARLVAGFRANVRDGRHDAGFDEVSALLNRLEIETLRGTARGRAQRLMAA